jgi:Succinyl-CoA synthetase, beta subunit
MKIHEFQGKEVFKSFSIPAPRGYLVDDEQNSSEVLKKALADFNSDTIVVKAQIHAGGRGKGGGVKVCKGFDDALKNINKIMGMQLVTHQTGSQGQKVRKIYLEEAFSIKKRILLRHYFG